LQAKAKIAHGHRLVKVKSEEVLTRITKKYSYLIQEWRPILDHALDGFPVVTLTNSPLNPSLEILWEPLRFDILQDAGRVAFMLPKVFDRDLVLLELFLHLNRRSASTLDTLSTLPLLLGFDIWVLSVAIMASMLALVFSCPLAGGRSSCKG